MIAMQIYWRNAIQTQFLTLISYRLHCLTYTVTWGSLTALMALVNESLPEAVAAQEVKQKY